MRPLSRKRRVINVRILPGIVWPNPASDARETLSLRGGNSSPFRALLRTQEDGVSAR